MAEVIDRFVEGITGAYGGILGYFSPEVGQAVNVFIIAVLIAITALFVWYFYRTLSQKNLISLNLSQYNRSEHPVYSKFLATGLYLLEYIILMPFLIFVWFAALSIFTLLITSERTVVQILMLSASLILAIRILAYTNQEISRDLAKLFPFITLSVFLLTPGSFDLSNSLSKLGSIQGLFTNILYFLLVVFAVEILLRVASTVVQFSRSAEKLSSGVAFRSGVKS